MQKPSGSVWNSPFPEPVVESKPAISCCVQPVVMPLQPPMDDPMFGPDRVSPAYRTGLVREKHNVKRQF